MHIMASSHRKYKVPYALAVCCLLALQLTSRIISISANDSERMSVSFSRRGSTIDSAVYPHRNDFDFATLPSLSTSIHRNESSSISLDSSATVPVPSRGITTLSNRERSSKCNTLTTSTLRQPNPFLLSSSPNTSSHPIYDYGKELLLYDALTRENSTSLLSAPFYAAGHCPAPFSQNTMKLLRDMGLGIDSLGNTVSCASVLECDSCYDTTGCHWCQDMKCHAMGSYYGCIYGSACDKVPDPCVRTQAEYLGTGAISFRDSLMVVAVSLISFIFIWGCLYLGFACGLTSSEKNYRDYVSLPSVDDDGLLDEELRSMQVVMQQIRPSQDSNRQILPRVAETAIAVDSQQPRLTVTSETGLPPASPLHADASSASGALIVNHSGGEVHDYRMPPMPIAHANGGYGYDYGVMAQSQSQSHSSQVVRRPRASSTHTGGLIRVVGRHKCGSSIVNTIYNGARCERYALYKVFVFLAAVFCFAAAFAGVILYPKMPEYSVCNKSIKWGSIFEYILNYEDSARLDVQFSLYNPNNFGLDLHDMKCTIKYKGAYVGKTGLRNIIIEPGTVQDFVLLTEIAPSVSTALDMAADYSEGTLMIDLDMKFDTNLRFWNVPTPRFNASFAYGDVDLNQQDQRLYCKCRK